MYHSTAAILPGHARNGAIETWCVRSVLVVSEITIRHTPGHSGRSTSRRGETASCRDRRRNTSQQAWHSRAATTPAGGAGPREVSCIRSMAASEQPCLRAQSAHRRAGQQGDNSCPRAGQSESWDPASTARRPCCQSERVHASERRASRGHPIRQTARADRVAAGSPRVDVRRSPPAARSGGGQRRHRSSVRSGCVSPPPLPPRGATCSNCRPRIARLQIGIHPVVVAGDDFPGIPAGASASPATIEEMPENKTPRKTCR